MPQSPLDYIAREDRAKRVGNVPLLIDNRMVRYFTGNADFTTNGAGAGNVTLPRPDRSFIRMWYFLCIINNTIVNGGSVLLAYRPDGDATLTLPLLHHQNFRAGYTYCPLIGSVITMPGPGAGGIDPIGVPVLPGPVICTDLEHLNVSLVGGALSTAVPMFGLYLDIPR